VLATVISRAAAAVETGMPLEGAREDSTDQAHAPTAAAAPRAWALEVVAAAAGVAAAGVVAAGGADERDSL
jgi:hypothetical protein